MSKTTQPLVFVVTQTNKVPFWYKKVFLLMKGRVCVCVYELGGSVCVCECDVIF